MADIIKFLNTERDALDKAFRRYSVKASVDARRSVVAGSSYVIYVLKFTDGERIGNVERISKEIGDVISDVRGGKTDVRFRYQPFGIEVPHPYPEPLTWAKARVLMRPGKMLVGRNYNLANPADDTLELNSENPHVLVAGTSGSGKSTLVRAMVSTLAYNCDPDFLWLFPVDLKNVDLTPFEHVAHVSGFASDREQAVRVIRKVHGIMMDRKDRRDTTGPMVVLVIDELSQLQGSDKKQNAAILGTLGEILTTGRAFRVHVIAATNKPTVDVLGKQASMNYSTRLIGRVATANEAATAAGRGETGAHLLPGRGSFLRIDGASMYRIQAYRMTDSDLGGMVDAINQRWPRRDGIVETVPVVPVYQEENTPVLAENWPVRGGTTGIPVSVPVQPVQPVQVVQPNFPIPNRALTGTEVEIVREMRAQGVSKNKIITEVWGGLEYKPKRLGWLNEALGEGE